MNQILNTERLEQAIHALRQTIETVNPGSLVESLNLFARSVDKLQAIAAMQAQNDFMKSQGMSPQYAEFEFRNI